MERRSWKVKREKKENERKKRVGDRKVGSTRGGQRGVWNQKQPTLMHSVLLVSSPDPLTLCILLKKWGAGGRERRDGSYRHWLHVRDCVCVRSSKQSEPRVQV